MAEGNKLAFSLGGAKKKKKSKTSTEALEGFVTETAKKEEIVNPDLPKEALVIPVQQDARQSLQEQARSRREKQQEAPSTKQETDEDAAAINALEQDAAQGGPTAPLNTSKMVIATKQNTFVREDKTDEDAEQLKQDLEKLAPEISVDDEVYQKVPIREFGAALLRGMGWTGQVSTKEEDFNMPRPSRLGLGATPKLMDAPTHSRRPRRQDQVQREERLKQQAEEYRQQQQAQLAMDKQQTLQIGSVVYLASENRRAIMRQLQGVPGLNMISVQFEGEDTPSKVKKGEIRLVERSQLQEQPFKEPAESRKESNDGNGKRSNRSRDLDDDLKRSNRSEDDEKRRKRRSLSEEDDRKRQKDRDDDPRRRDDDDGDRRQRRSSRDDEDRRRGDRRSRDNNRRDERRSSKDDRKRRRDEEESSLKRSRHGDAPPTTWVIPNIRVRVVTAKLGKSHYKEKGVVVDVTHKGTATLKMDNGQVLQVPERYLETALPKIGGNTICLTGEHRLAKGRLLERDSRAGKGSIQIFEDMNVATLSLDDLAEWVGPLDNDLYE
jgi:hypothetical protein